MASAALFALYQGKRAEVVCWGVIAERHAAASAVRAVVGVELVKHAARTVDTAPLLAAPSRQRNEPIYGGYGPENRPHDDWARSTD